MPGLRLSSTAFGGLEHPHDHRIDNRQSSPDWRIQAPVTSTESHDWEIASRPSSPSGRGRQVSQNRRTFEYNAKGALPDFLANTEMIANNAIRSGGLRVMSRG